jgi:hypothetical protein
MDELYAEPLSLTPIRWFGFFGCSRSCNEYQPAAAALGAMGALRYGAGHYFSRTSSKSHDYSHGSERPAGNRSIQSGVSENEGVNRIFL